MDTQTVSGVMSVDMTAVWVALIGAFSTICAAGIAFFGARKIAETVKKDGFTSYSEDSFDAFDIMRHAKKNIVIVANFGGTFLEKYESVIRSYMKNGVNVYYLLQSFEGCSYMDHYINGDKDTDFRQFERGLQIMQDLLNSRSEGKFIMRYIDTVFTASYVTADIELEKHLPKKMLFDEKTSVIHVMIYQYGKKTSVSPIFHIDKGSYAQYIGTIETIRNLWKDAKVADNEWLEDYRIKIDDAVNSGVKRYNIKFDRS